MPRRCPTSCACDCHCHDGRRLHNPHPWVQCPGKTWPDYFDEVALANSKRRCTYCKHYVPADQINRQGCCTDDCTRKLVERRQQARKRSDRSLASAVALEHQTKSGTPKKKKKKKAQGSIDGPVRARVRRRDGNRCRMAGANSAYCSGFLQVHHIKYVSEFGRGRSDPHCDQDSNLILLCSHHHNDGVGSVHSDKRRWQPACRAYIWLLYVHGVQLSLLEIDRHLRAGDDEFTSWVVARWVDSQYHDEVRPA